MNAQAAWYAPALSLTRSRWWRAAGAVFGLLLFINLAALLAGSAPRDVYTQLYRTVWSTYGLAQTAFLATPLILLGTALSLSGRSGLINIGAEGQLVVASLAVGALGPHLGANPVSFAVLVCAALFAGGSFALVPAWLRSRLGAPEVMTTIMLNFVAYALSNYAIGFLADKDTTHTASVDAGLLFHRLAPSTGSQLSTAFVFAVVLAVLCDYVLTKTRLGFAVFAYGANPKAALLAGLSPRIPLLAFVASGALSGLAALHYTLGGKGFHEDGFSSGAGFVGLSVALAAGLRPMAVVPVALGFGFLSHAALAINALVPKELADVVTAVVMIIALGGRQK